MMTDIVNLIWLGNDNPPEWRLGNVWSVSATPVDVHNIIQTHLSTTNAQAWLFWHNKLDLPNTDFIEQILNSRGNVWHAGLRLGTSGKPHLINFVSPTWMLNKDPSPAIEATSWRISLDACLISTEVLRQLGGIYPEFESLDGAALEMGHRYITRGALVRHVPNLVSGEIPEKVMDVPFIDQLRFVRYRFRGWFYYWVLFRIFWTGCVKPWFGLRHWKAILRVQSPPEPQPFIYETLRPLSTLDNPKVSVLIPTIDRYTYLHTLLDQLRIQTVKPHEIIIVDQTSKNRRDSNLANLYPDLPIKVFYLDRAGQCSSRNMGLRYSSGDYILFLDDDDEVEPDLLEKHLKNIQFFSADVSSGSADEVGAGSLPEYFTYLRISNVFPTNNTLIKRGVLHKSGLFDLAYNKGKRADGDLGMRVYSCGTFMIYDPAISVLHHHAPQGGLRTHKARIITYASSRQRLLQRHISSIYDLYLWYRYFTDHQINEAVWINMFATFSIRGNIFRRAIKFMVMLFLLPQTYWKIDRNRQFAEKMTQSFPQIPDLDRLKE